MVCVSICSNSCNTHFHTQWSIFLQERVVSEIYSMALSERNQQVLCQVNICNQKTLFLHYTWYFINAFVLAWYHDDACLICCRLVFPRGSWPSAALCCLVMVTLSMRLSREPLKSCRTNLSHPLTSGNGVYSLYMLCVQLTQLKISTIVGSFGEIFFSFREFSKDWTGRFRSMHAPMALSSQINKFINFAKWGSFYQVY